MISCTNGNKITETKIDGSCQAAEFNLFTKGEHLSLEELEGELKNIFGGRISPSLRTELDEIRTEYSIGDKLFEVSSDDKSWKGLYGSAGYGLIRDNCIIVYIELVVS
ncbi:MAG: hypothetical protein WBC60_15695 [Cognaticolwellia sp.]